MADCCAGASTSSLERPRRGAARTDNAAIAAALRPGRGGLLDEADDDALDALAQWVRGPEQIRPVIRAGHELEAPRRRKRSGCDATGNRSEKEAGLAHRPTELVYFDLHAGDRNLVSRYKRALGCKPSSRDNLSLDAELVGAGGPHSGIIAPRPAAVHSLWKAPALRP
jgi:hypothetical protein